MGRYSKIVKKKKSNKRRLLPESLNVFLARRIIDCTALTLILTGVLITLGILSYSKTDPSWNTASADTLPAIHNLLGKPGAYTADILLQTLGAAGILFGVVFALWGAKLWRRIPIAKPGLRLITLICAVSLASMAFARIPSGFWVPQAYLGGSIGAIMLNSISGLFQHVIGQYSHTITAAAAGIAAIPALIYSLSLSKQTLIGIAYNCGAAIRYSALSIAGIALAFYDWVTHYGDPDYALANNLKTHKAEKKTAKQKKEKTAPVITQTDTAQSPRVPATKSEIKVVNPKKAEPQSGSNSANKQTSFALQTDGEWEFPSLDLLQDVPQAEKDDMPDEDALRKNAEMLQSILADFNVEGEIVSIHPGPVVTLYELEPAPGVKTSRVIGLSDDIARSMAAVSVRCSVIPGRNVIGIELPNKRRQTVYMREMLQSENVQSTKALLPLILGKDISGNPVIADLAKMPHLLVAGTTGSGKSVSVNTMLLSLIYSLPPEKCRFIMIDPKMLELSVYDDIPQLLTPVVTEPGKAVVALKWAVQEMENRYRSMSKLGVRNIEGYNARLAEARKKGETIMHKVQTGFDPDTGKPVFEEQAMDMTDLPYIVIIVDEFADLMLVAGKDVENAIQRLAQMARAAGIHMIMATQRPSVDVITGVIKANFPTRISFSVTSKIDSRTILGEGGAEQLLGMGDMLFMAPGGQIKRVHGPFVSDDEVESVVGFLKSQSEPSYINDVTDSGSFGDSEVMGALFGEDGDSDDKVDELYDKAVALVAREQKASTSFVQRHMQIGYNRAARIVEEMEKQGVIGPANHVGKREVLVSDYSDV